MTHDSPTVPQDVVANTLRERSWRARRNSLGMAMLSLAGLAVPFVDIAFRNSANLNTLGPTMVAIAGMLNICALASNVRASRLSNAALNVARSERA